MDTEFEFDGLFHVRPGVTTAREVYSLLGIADGREVRSQSTSSSELGSFLFFQENTIAIGFEGNPNLNETLVYEVRLLKGNATILKCGLHVGMERRNACELICQKFTVTDVFDDSIYFTPSTERPLVACAEFIQANVITSLELYNEDHF